MFSHAVSTSVPTGVTAPSPVITTLFFHTKYTPFFLSVLIYPNEERLLPMLIRRQNQQV